MIRCDICGRRPAVITVSVKATAGSNYGKETRRERWCEPCALAVLDRYPGPYIWPARGIWLTPKEIPA